jgi:hypothetical protein
VALQQDRHLAVAAQDQVVAAVAQEEAEETKSILNIFYP